MERKNISEKDLLSLSKKCYTASLMVTDLSGLTISVRRKKDGSGSIKFLHRVQIDGKNYRNILGSFPEISLSLAKERYFKSVQAVENNEPLPTFDDKKEEVKEVVNYIVDEKFYFKNYFDQWFELKRFDWRKNTVKLYLSFRDKFAPIFDIDIRKLTPQIALDFLKPFIEKGLNATVSKLTVILNSVMNYACFKQDIQFNPLDKMALYLPKIKVKHRACFEEETMQDDLKTFFNALSCKSKQLQCCIYFVFFSLLRNSEAHNLKFGDIKGNFAIVKTKTNDEFKFPLSAQALKVIEYIRSQYDNVTDDMYIFSLNNGKDAISSRSLTDALLSLGYKDKLTIHGIRSLGRQWLQRLPNAKESFIELCLSHKVGGLVQQAYNRSDYLEERRPLMQKWSDFIEVTSSTNFVNLFENH